MLFISNECCVYRYFIHNSILGKVTIQKKHFQNNREIGFWEVILPFRQRHTNIRSILTITAKGIALFVDKLILITFRCIRGLYAQNDDTDIVPAKDNSF